LPAALDRLGGWVNPDSADWFSEYAQVLFRMLDDRVKLWVTLNEPWVVVDGGYLHGVLAPGQRNPFAAPLAAHNLLRAHAKAMQAYRAEGRHQIGLVVNLEPKYPAAETVEDLNATMRPDAYWNRYYLDPVFLGGYPPELPEIFGPAWPAFPDADFDLIRQAPDFLGINYYSRQVVRHDPADWPLNAARVRQTGQTHTGLDWEVYPQGLADILEWVAGRYGSLPLYVTENGAAFYDPPQADGGIDDPLRRNYLRDHLRAALNAMQSGVDLRGYFAWSLLDNFEWAYGYSQRFVATLWADPCRLCHPAAHPQSERAVLRGSDSRSRRCLGCERNPRGALNLFSTAPSAIRRFRLKAPKHMPKWWQAISREDRSWRMQRPTNFIPKLTSNGGKSSNWVCTTRKISCTASCRC